jgi:hypothetical protein
MYGERLFIHPRCVWLMQQRIGDGRMSMNWKGRVLGCGLLNTLFSYLTGGNKETYFQQGMPLSFIKTSCLITFKIITVYSEKENKFINTLYIRVFEMISY